MELSFGVITYELVDTNSLLVKANGDAPATELAEVSEKFLTLGL